MNSWVECMLLKSQNTLVHCWRRVKMCLHLRRSQRSVSWGINSCTKEPGWDSSLWCTPTPLKHFWSDITLIGSVIALIHSPTGHKTTLVANSHAVQCMDITFTIITLPPKGASAKKQIGNENSPLLLKDSKNATTSKSKDVHLPCKCSVCCPYSFTDISE